MSVVPAPRHPLVHALGAVHRLLRAGASGEPARRRERGLRAHRPCQGTAGAAGAGQAHAAHVADHVRQSLRPRLRHPRRRRCTADRGRLRAAGRRAADLSLARLARPAGDHGTRDLRRLLHHHRQRARRRPLRAPRPADQAGLAMAEPLLEVKDLKVSFRTEDGVVRAVDGVSFTVDQGEVLGIVGESGSGKSVSMLSVLRLINDPNMRVEGEVIYKGRDLMKLHKDEMRQVRGAEIAMIFQDPMTSLNPVYRGGDQIVAAILIHQDIGKPAARRRAIELLHQVGIPSAEARVDDFPHQFSGGMRQRAMIAMALANNPDILIADEPTTALDVTIQAQIIELIDKLKDEFNSAIILITHDLGVVAEIADRIGVMYAGRIVEFADKRQIFYDPQHPYTWGLLGSFPRLDRGKQERLHSIKGTPPSLIRTPTGCKFRPRCPHAFDKCMEEPALENRVEEPGHLDRCWLALPEKRQLRVRTLAGEAAA